MAVSKEECLNYAILTVVLNNNLQLKTFAIYCITFQLDDMRVKRRKNNGKGFDKKE